MSISQNNMRIWRQFMKNGQKLVKIGQILPKTNIFEVGQLFSKKNLFLKRIMLKDPPKIFMKTFGHFRPFYENLIWDHVFQDFWVFRQKMADLADSAGRSADVADLKISGQRCSLHKNSKSRTTPNRCWDIFIFVNGP